MENDYFEGIENLAYRGLDLSKFHWSVDSEETSGQRIKVSILHYALTTHYCVPDPFEVLVKFVPLEKPGPVRDSILLFHGWVVV